MDLGINLINPKDYLTKFQDKDKGPTRLVGKLAMTQKFIKIFLTNPGTNIYGPSVEGIDPSSGFREMLATKVSENVSMAYMRALITGYANSTMEIMVAQQEKYGLPLNERIASVKVLDVYRSGAGTITVEMELENVTGDKFRTLIDQGKVVNFG